MNLSFEEIIPFLRKGGIATTHLPNGKIHKLAMIDPALCDHCPFVDAELIIVTVDENENDQKYGLWTTAQEDVQHKWEVGVDATVRREVVYEPSYIARDPNKEYPHGWGFVAPIIKFKQDMDPSECAGICRVKLSDEEFECVGATPRILISI